jgi:hypothetical protein
MGIGIITCGLLGAAPFPLAAQEAVQQQEGSGGQMEMQKMMEKHPGMMGDMHKMHEQMEKMHQEMGQELQKQMTALREHTKVMEGINDEKQLLGEMKKHQQMTDALLGTMLEQREKMHAQMQKRHEQMRSRMGKKQPMEGSGTEPSEEHEQHHGK